MRKWGLNLLLGLASLSLFLGLAEWLLPQGPKPKKHKTPKQITCGNCGYLYHHNPEHPEINSQGLRDRTYFEKSGKSRTLFLGDSVTFGSGIPKDRVFSALLETESREMINAGVEGYSPYNALKYLEEKGLQFQPDHIVMGVCLNDMVNPLLHWASRSFEIESVPLEAVPNPHYHESYAQPRFRLRRLQHQMARFGLTHLFSRAILPKLERRLYPQKQKARLVGKRVWPIYLTLEDSLSIESLLNESDPRWSWMEEILLKMKTISEGANARFSVMLFPLAYQLDPAYPFLPQKRFQRFCRGNNVHCLDLLPIFRRAKNSLFRLDDSTYYDIWHLSAEGHRVTAAALKPFLSHKL